MWMAWQRAAASARAQLRAGHISARCSAAQGVADSMLGARPCADLFSTQLRCISQQASRGLQHPRPWQPAVYARAQAAGLSSSPQPDSEDEALLEQQDRRVRQAVQILVFGVLVAAAASVFPTMTGHNLRSTLAYLNAPDPEWQLQGLKSARWVADDQDRLQALVRNGGLALLVSLLGSRSPEVQRQALELLDEVATREDYMEQLVRAGAADALEQCGLLNSEDAELRLRTARLLVGVQTQQYHVE